MPRETHHLVKIFLHLIKNKFNRNLLNNFFKFRILLFLLLIYVNIYLIHAGELCNNQTINIFQKIVYNCN